MSICHFNECSDRIFYSRVALQESYLLPDVHCHANYEVFFLISGNILYFTDYGIVLLSPGDFALIPPFVKHQTYHFTGNTERIILSFFSTHIKNMDKQMLTCFQTPHIKDGWSLFPLLEEIGKEYKRDEPLSLCAVEALTSLLLIHLSRITAGSPVPESNPLMEQVKIDITEHYMLDISLDDLALKYNMSKSHFSKKFKSYAGVGFHEFVTLVRIQNAERLLVTTSESVTEVASLCGFNDSSHFTQTFKKLKGMTPGEYKKKNRI